MSYFYSLRLSSAALAALMAVVLVASPVSAQVEDPGSDEEFSAASVQIVNLAGEASVDVYLNGIRVAADVSGEEATPMLAVLSAEVEVNITKAGNRNQLAAFEFSAESGKVYHIVFGEAQGNPLYASSVQQQEASVVETPLPQDGRVAVVYFNDTEEAHGASLNGNVIAVTVPPGEFAPSVVASAADGGLALGGISFNLPLGELDGQSVAVVSAGSSEAKAVYVVLPSGQMLLVRPDGASKTGGDVALASTVTARGAQPNPFVGSTTLAFDVTERSEVQVDVFDALGRLVGRVDGGTFEVGSHRLPLAVGALAPGTYAYRLSAHTASGTAVSTGRMTALR